MKTRFKHKHKQSQLKMRRINNDQDFISRAIYDIYKNYHI